MTITTGFVETARGRFHLRTCGPTDGTPVVLIHGNLSTGAFFHTVMTDAPSHLRIIAPDMRGFGRSEPRVIDATRGLRDWSDDLAAILDALDLDAPVHLAGWSTGGAAIGNFVVDHPQRVASLTFIDPVSPYGFGASHRDGTPATNDHAGAGGGGGNPEFVANLVAGDRSADSPLTIRSVLRAAYWSPDFTVDADLEDLFVDEILLSEIGDRGYPGDATASDNWPGFAPGTVGVLNALSPKYCHWADIVEAGQKPPVLWVHGSADVIVANQSAWDVGALGAAELIPGWPGADDYPIQPMVDQIDDVVDAYAESGGEATKLMVDGAGHGPHIDHADTFRSAFFSHIEAAG